MCIRDRGTGRFVLYSGDSRIIRKNWHVCVCDSYQTRITQVVSIRSFLIREKQILFNLVFTSRNVRCVITVVSKTQNKNLVLSNELIKPNFCFDLSHRRSTKVSLETRNSSKTQTSKLQTSDLENSDLETSDPLKND